MRQAERKGLLKVHSPGTSNAIVPSGGDLGTGRSCPVISNFEVASLDPGESVTTTYLLNPLTGQTAQDNATNQGYVAGATLLHGNSANAVLDQYVDPILGCTPFEAPDLSRANAPTSSEALDEIAADAHQPKTAALVPENGKVVMNGDKPDPAKTDLYREELGQAPVSAATNKSSSPAMYCQNLVDIQTPFLAANQRLLAAGQSPLTAAAGNLLTFLANDLSASFTSLGCQQFHLTNPVSLKRNSRGVAITAKFDTAAQTARDKESDHGCSGSGESGQPALGRRCDATRRTGLRRR